MYNHCNVPRKNLKLHRWVNYQRKAYVLRRSILTPKRIELLKKLNFEFVSQIKNDAEDKNAQLIPGPVSKGIVKKKIEKPPSWTSTSSASSVNKRSIDCSSFNAKRQRHNYSNSLIHDSREDAKMSVMPSVLQNITAIHRLDNDCSHIQNHSGFINNSSTYQMNPHVVNDSSAYQTFLGNIEKKKTARLVNIGPVFRNIAIPGFVKDQQFQNVSKTKCALPIVTSSNFIHPITVEKQNLTEHITRCRPHMKGD